MIRPVLLIPKTFLKVETYSERRLFTGFTIAALIVWKLDVMKAVSSIPAPLAANIHQLIVVLSA